MHEVPQQKWFKQTAVEVRALVSDYIPHFYVDFITYPSERLTVDVANLLVKEARVMKLRWWCFRSKYAVTTTHIGLFRHCLYSLHPLHFPICQFNFVAALQWINDYWLDLNSNWCIMLDTKINIAHWYVNSFTVRLPLKIFVFWP